ncbi:MAG TPA: hypothetical protein PLR99_24330 [Polyangiaceae bacterium]|nr:hypothetical protein [Polyangiaceae bacterium]
MNQRPSRSRRSARALALASALVAVGCSSAATDPPGPGAGGLYRGGTRLKVRVMTADGDAKAFQGLHDATLDVDCLPGKAADGSLRCIPSGGLVAYSDAQCTQPVVVKGGAGCGTVSKFAAAQPKGGCGEVEVYEVGADVPGTAAFTGGPGKCFPLPAANVPGLAAATRVDPSRLAAFTEADVAAGPVTLKVVNSADGASVVLGTTITATGEACTARPPLNEPQGAPACFPHGSSADRDAGAFADAACATPVASTPAADTCRRAPVKSATLFVATGDACRGYREEFYALGEETSAGFMKVGGTCQPAVPGDPSAPAYKYFKLGAKLDLAAAAPAAQRATLGTGRLKVTQYTVGGTVVSEDTGGFVDGETSCSSRPFADGVLRCVPEVLVTRGGDQPVFGDAACTKRVYRSNASACATTAPRYLVEESDPCGKVGKVYALGAPFSGTQAYFGDPNDAKVCIPFPVADAKLYEAGAEVAPDTAFPRLTTRLE